MIKQLPASPRGFPSSVTDSSSDDFLQRLDERFARSRERQWRRLLAWGEVLDAAGWCVVLTPATGHSWLSGNAIRDLQSRGCLPGDSSGAAGFPEELHLGVVVGGFRVWPACLADTAATSAAENLTKREREIFDWLRDGKSGPEISVILGCSVRTVEKHVANLYRKIGVTNRAAAILLQTPGEF